MFYLSVHNNLICSHRSRSSFSKSWKMEEIHKEIMENWLHTMQTVRKVYKDPVLDAFKINRIKLLCDNMDQETHVFLMAVEVIEAYIAIKYKNNTIVDNPLLFVLTTIYLCGKYVGDLSDYKTTSLIILYRNLTGDNISNTEVKLMEMNILATIDFRLPLHTTIDDLKALLEFYISSLRLKVDLTTLSENMLIFYTMYSTKIFTNLKLHYIKKMDTYKRFIEIYSNRLYLPIGFIICSIKVSKLINILDLQKICADLSGISGIHPDELNFLSDEIIKYWNIRKREIFQ